MLLITFIYYSRKFFILPKSSAGLYGTQQLMDLSTKHTDVHLPTVLLLNQKEHENK